MYTTILLAAALQDWEHYSAHALAAREVAVAEAPKQRPVRVGQKVGRNDPCPCGSGKKYKQCHGKLS